jgi:hypothetical protein
VVQPITIPHCPAGSPHRLLDDPNTLLLFVNCSTYDLATQALPVGCNWFDTPDRPGTFAATITIQSAFPAVQLIAVLILFAWLRSRGRPGPFAVAAAAAAGLGAVLLLLASAEHFNYLAPAAVALLGVGWLGAVRLVPTRGLAVLTLVLGIAAVLEAVDSGIILLPSPIGFVWVRVILEVAWIVWAAAALLRGSKTRRQPAPGWE